MNKGFNAKQLRGLIVESVVMGEWEPYDFAGGSWGAEFKAACAAWKIDLKQIEEEVQASGKTK